MYDKSDPRASLAAAPAANAPKPVTEYFGAQAGCFYEMEPQEKTAKSKTWITRAARAMVICYSDVEAGAEFSRDSQVDEYVLLLPEKETTVEVTTEMDGTKKVDGYTCSFLPPGKSKIKVLTKGRIVSMFHAEVEGPRGQGVECLRLYQAAPDRAADRAVARSAGRLQAAHLLARREGRARPLRPHLPLHPLHGELPRPRAPARVTRPRSRRITDDFEQCSLCLNGTFTHHLRWPWTTNMKHLAAGRA